GTVIRVRSRVNVQHGGASAGAQEGVLAGNAAGECDGVPDRSYLQGDQVIELVAAVRGGGQAEPAPCRDLLDRVLERGGRDVMAFVGDDKAVPGGQVRDVVAAGQGLQDDDIDGAAQLGPAAAKLPGSDAEELSDPGPPLVRQRLPVH